MSNAIKIIPNDDSENQHLLSLKINLYDILHDAMHGEMRANLIESISCADEVIGHVASQLVEGYTYNGFAGSWATNRDTALQQAREKIAINYSYAEQRTIEDLLRQVKSLQDDVEYWKSRLYNQP